MLERKAKYPVGCRDCRIRLFKYFMLISATGVRSVVIATKAAFSISFYTGQTNAKAKKLSDTNKMVWI